MPTRSKNKEIAELRNQLIGLHGKVDNLTTLVAAYQKDLTKVESRQWHSLFTAAGAMFAAILSFIFRFK